MLHTSISYPRFSGMMSMGWWLGWELWKTPWDEHVFRLTILPSLFYYLFEREMRKIHQWFPIGHCYVYVFMYIITIMFWWCQWMGVMMIQLLSRYNIEDIEVDELMYGHVHRGCLSMMGIFRMSGRLVEAHMVVLMMFILRLRIRWRWWWL